MTIRNDDPYASADAAEYNPTRTYFGQVHVDVWYAMLQKGIGKVPFDAGQHDPARRVTAIDIEVTTIGERSFTIKRELIAESKEWAQIVKPSLRNLNHDLRSIEGKWVQVDLADTGQRYTNKAGEEKARTTLKFVAVFDTQGACEAASSAYFTRGGEDSPVVGAAPPPTQPPANGNGKAANSEAEKATAAKFLPSLWKASGQDLAKMQELLGKTPLVNKYYTIDSPDVLAVIGG